MAVDSGTYTDETLWRRRQLAEQLARTNAQPIQHWTQGLARIAENLMGGYEDARLTQEGKDRDYAGSAAIAKALGVDMPPQPERQPGGLSRIAALLSGNSPAAPQGSPPAQRNAPQGQLPAPPAPWASGDGNSVVGRIIGNESGNDPNARNPNSSASGLGQFINSTWLATIKSKRPDLAAGKSDAELLAMRNDPALSREMTAAYAQQNGDILRQGGQQVTPGTTYLAHFAGPQGALSILEAPPGASVESILGSKVVAANPFLRNMTAGDLRAWADRKMGGGTRVASIQPPTMNDAGPQPPMTMPQSPPPAMDGSLPTFAQAGAPSMPPPTPIQPGSAPNPPPTIPQGDPRRVAAALMANPATAQQGRALAMQILAAGANKDPTAQALAAEQLKAAQRQNAQAAQTDPLDVRQKTAATLKAERDLEGEGATPLTPAERQQYGITAEQPAYKTRTGEIKFGPAASKTQVAIDQRQESEFGKETGKSLAKRFDELATAGDAAVQDRQLISEMRRLGTKIETGAFASLKSMAANLGIKLDGASDIEGFNALINRLTPQQRLPGSGATSDFDAKMFRESLPRLINTPEGNALVLDTMDKIAENKIARGDIAMQVQAGELTPKQGLEAIRKLQAEARTLSDKISEAAKNSGKPGTAAPASNPALDDLLKKYGR